MTELRVLEGGGANPIGIGTATYIWLNRKDWICSRTKVISMAKTPEGEDVPLVEPWKMVDEVEARDDSQTTPWQTRFEPKLSPQTFILSPCYYVPDPLRPQPSFLVLCEVRNLDDIPDEWNSRDKLRKYLEGETLCPWWGVRQSFPSSDVKAQEQFIMTCVDSGLRLHSADRLSYWMGVRHISDEIDAEEPSSLIVADQLVLSRFLCQQLFQPGTIPLSIPMGNVALYLSTAESRVRPAAIRELHTHLLNGLNRDDPDPPGESSSPYADMLAASRPRTNWKGTISEGISIRYRIPNYVRISGLPADVDPYEAMLRILKVLVEAQRKPPQEP